MPNERELTHGIPLFLDQLSAALLLARSSDVIDHEELTRGARKHGHELLRLGLTIGQVVHDYGDVCQTITALAVRLGVDIATAEFRTLNLCLDDAIAGAVTEYALQRELSVSRATTERLGVFAHELRNALNAGTLAFASIQSGVVSAGGSTALVLGRSLTSLRTLIDRSLAEVRIEAGLQHFERLRAAELVEELEIAALLLAHARGLRFEARSVGSDVVLDGDRHILVSALSNLLENAFKFTRKGSLVRLQVSATPEHVTFAVEDECGGLPPGRVERLLEPFQQAGADRTGLGLGLVIAHNAARVHAGELQIRDVPGHGCVVAMVLPRAKELPPPRDDV